MTAVAPFVATYLVLVGFMSGSFINLAADRIPRAESLVRPRSHCRSCGRTLNALDLLPVAGYLIRKGRCATCRVAIGVSSPLVETVSGVLVLIPIIWLGLWPGAAAGLVLLVMWGSAVVRLAVRRGGARA